MILTSIGESNYDAFKPLLAGIGLNSEDLFIGAEEDDKPVGAAVISGNEDLLNVDYIYVVEEYRRKGIGSSMILLPSLEAKAKHVSAGFSGKDKTLTAFFEHLGFFLSEGADSYTIPVKTLLASEQVQKMKNAKRSSSVKSLSELNNAEKQLLFKKLEIERAGHILHDEDLCEPLSFVCLSKDSKEITSYFICEKNENLITIMFLKNYSGNVAEIMALFAALASEGSKSEYEDCEICFVTMEDGITEIVSKLVGDIEPDDKMIYAIK